MRYPPEFRAWLRDSGADPDITVDDDLIAAFIICTARSSPMAMATRPVSVSIVKDHGTYVLYTNHPATRHELGRARTLAGAHNLAVDWYGPLNWQPLDLPWCCRADLPLS